MPIHIINYYLYYVMYVLRRVPLNGDRHDNHQVLLFYYIELAVCWNQKRKIQTKSYACNIDHNK